MTTPTQEAAAILTRIFESLARASGKTLKPTTRDDITRACELLASAGQELDDLLDDLPRVSPAEAAANFIPAEQIDPTYRQWRAERKERTER
jgi:hypothetical protein